MSNLGQTIARAWDFNKGTQRLAHEPEPLGQTMKKPRKNAEKFRKARRRQRAAQSPRAERPETHGIVPSEETEQFVDEVFDHITRRLREKILGIKHDGTPGEESLVEGEDAAELGGGATVKQSRARPEEARQGRNKKIVGARKERPK